MLDNVDITEDEMLSHINVLNSQLWNDSYDYGGYRDIDYRAEMRMKMAADETELTQLEKTMTREQLYEAKNIAWAKGMTIREIINWMNDWEQSHPFVSVDGRILFRQRYGCIKKVYAFFFFDPRIRQGRSNGASPQTPIST